MIAIIDYDAGNTCSVMNALRRIGVDFTLTDSPDEIRKASKVIFPGVGHAAAAMDALKRKQLDGLITNLTQPVLGICVGMQLLCKQSEEGNIPCLGILDDEVVKFEKKAGQKVPHMGWNMINHLNNDKIFNGLVNGGYYYFVHSYYVPKNVNTIASCDYFGEFSAMVCVDNFYGVQFHAEKSGDIGEKLIRNFLEQA